MILEFLDDLIFGVSSIEDATSKFGPNTNKWNISENCGKSELSSSCKVS